MLLIHHAARCRHAFPPSSLAALRACAEAQARVVEVDIQPLADGEYALLHNALLEEGTTGRGPVGGQSARALEGLRLVWQGMITGEPVPLLSRVVDLVRGQPFPQELQLDLKVYPSAPAREAALRSLAELVAPLGQRVRVSSTADWALRRLHALAPDLLLGFDPLLYLDVRPADSDRDAPPYRTGAYGYRDDHPLASRRWGTAAEYLRKRVEALWLQAPMAGIWYIRAQTLARALDDGFDWIAYLHERGVLVAAWTLDPAEPGHLPLARRLAAAGADRITSNDAPALAEALGGAEY